jgi:hypothetical protein
VDFEAICKEINEYPPAQETLRLIEECELETQRLTKACNSDKISLKQKQLSQIVSLINEFKLDGLDE